MERKLWVVRLYNKETGERKNVKSQAWTSTDATESVLLEHGNGWEAATVQTYEQWLRRNGR